MFTSLDIKLEKRPENRHGIAKIPLRVLLILIREPPKLGLKM